MINWPALLPWLLRAWPVLALAPLFIAHYFAITLLPSSPEAVNNVVGSVLQFTGGLLILYSIDQNLGLFRDESFFSTILSWFMSFPIKRNIVVRSPASSMHAAMSTAAGLTGFLPASSIEERVKELERAMQTLRDNLRGEVERLNARIANAQNEFTQSVDATNAKVASLAKRIEEATVGGMKLQAFGVLLALYGAVTSVFA
jgi:uncharacterized protein YoxC